jgi:hypothetical protein
MNWASRLGRPTRRTGNRCELQEAPTEQAAVTAFTTRGRKSVPYCVLERSYSAGSVRIVLAAGKVTSAIPGATPAT